MPSRRRTLTFLARGSVAAAALAAAQRAGLPVPPPVPPATATAPSVLRSAPPLAAEATRVDLTRSIHRLELIPGRGATTLLDPWQADAEVTLSMAALPAWEAAFDSNDSQPFHLEAGDMVWEWLGLVTEVRMEAELGEELTATARVQSVGPIRVRQGRRWTTLGETG